MTTKVAHQIRIPRGGELFRVRDLRHAVLDPARKVPVDRDLSWQDHHPDYINMATFCGDTVISAVRLEPREDGVFSVRKMATHPDYQGQGIGAHVLEKAEVLAIARGAVAFTLDSRESSIGFYEKQGYVLTGEEVTHHDGVPNFTMTKQVE